MVSILPVLLKVLEQAVFNQVIEYLNINKILHPDSHAYQAKHNTETDMISAYDKWVGAVDEGLLCGVVLH